MNCKTVFVTQIPNRRDRDTGAMIPAFNVGPAAEFGQIEVIMPAAFSFFNTAEMVTQLRNTLVRYDYARGDSIVLSGDPTVIAASAAILAERNKRFRILRWEKQVGKYIPIEIHL